METGTIEVGDIVFLLTSYGPGKERMCYKIIEKVEELGGDWDRLDTIIKIPLKTLHEKEVVIGVVAREIDPSSNSWDMRDCVGVQLLAMNRKTGKLDGELNSELLVPRRPVDLVVITYPRQVFKDTFCDAVLKNLRGSKFRKGEVAGGLVRPVANTGYRE